MKITVRILNRFRLYTVVNIVGLALSLACIILIARYVYQEKTVNHFATDINRTYITYIDFQNRDPLVAGFKFYMNQPDYDEFISSPSIEMSSVFFDFEDGRVFLDDDVYIISSIVADSNFIKILPYPVLVGTADFRNPNDAVITQQLANKMFGDENPVGKTIIYTQGEPLHIIGVIGEPKTKTSLKFDLFVNNDLKDDWRRSGHELVLLKEGANVEHINNIHTEFKHLRAYNETGRYQLYPFKDLYSNRSLTIYSYENPVFIRSDSGNLQILVSAAIFILLVGIFNFINIYQVVSIRRSKSMGVSIIHGAKPHHIFRDIYLENFIMVVISIFLCWWLIELMETLLYNHLDFEVRANKSFDIITSALALMLIPILTTIFPFIRVITSTSLNSIKSINGTGASMFPRKMFLFLQYLITFGLLTISMFFIKQVRYMINADLGYNTENVMMCTLMSMQIIDYSSTEAMQNYARTLESNMQLIEQKMNETTLFTNWTLGRAPYKTEAIYPVSVDGKEDYQTVSLEFSDHQYMNLLGFQLLEGRLWDSTDVFEQYKCIVNESVIRMFNIEDINSVRLQFNTRLWYSSQSSLDMSINPSYEIVVVVEDFNTGHLSKSTLPLVFVYNERPNPYSFLMGRFLPGKEKEAAEYLKELHKEINGNAEFHYSLLDDNIANLYEDDRKVSNVYITISLLSIIISCLGLFALSLFDIQQRRKEIALRKINGATKKDLVHLLLKKYGGMLISSFLISIPLSYFILYRYL